MLSMNGFLPEKDRCGGAGRVKEESPEWGVTGDLSWILLMLILMLIPILLPCDQVLIVPADQGMATGFSFRHCKGFTSPPPPDRSTLFPKTLA